MKALGRFALAAGMIAKTTNVRVLFHRLACLAAILAFRHDARTNRVLALLATRCHIVSPWFEFSLLAISILAAASKPRCAIKNTSPFDCLSGSNGAFARRTPL